MGKLGYGLTYFSLFFIHCICEVSGSQGRCIIIPSVMNWFIFQSEDNKIYFKSQSQKTNPWKARILYKVNQRNYTKKIHVDTHIWLFHHRWWQLSFQVIVNTYLISDPSQLNVTLMIYFPAVCNVLQFSFSGEFKGGLWWCDDWESERKRVKSEHGRIQITFMFSQENIYKMTTFEADLKKQILGR